MQQSKLLLINDGSQGANDSHNQEVTYVHCRPTISNLAKESYAYEYSAKS
jgi:hypothetical protein